MGEDRAIEAAKQAVSSPLLETSIQGATDAIINVTGGVNLTLFEAEQAAEVVRAASNTDINTIFGSVINENLTDEVIVTVIATGFDKNKEEKELLYNNVQNITRRTAPREIEVIEDDFDDDDDGDDDFPIFLQNKNF
jgi:cell division protein FtsZ